LNISIFEYFVKATTRGCQAGKFTGVLQVSALPHSLQFQAVGIINLKTVRIPLYGSRI